MNSQTTSTNSNELVMEAREKGFVWSSSRGAKDCLIGLIFVFLSQTLGSLSTISGVHDLWDVAVTGSVQNFFSHPFLKQIAWAIVVFGAGLGMLVLLAVMIQTRGFVSFRGALEEHRSSDDSFKVEVVRFTVAAIFIVLMGREVLPDAYLLAERAAISDYGVIFKTVFARAALCFLIIGAIEIILARRDFFNRLTLSKAPD